MVGEPESSGVQQPTPRDWRRLTLSPAVLFGAVGLPLMVLVGWLWLEDAWKGCTGFGCLGGLVLVFYGFAMGLCFWYLAGLSWGWPVGLVGPAIGALIGPLVVAAALVGFDRDDLVGDIMVVSWIVAVVGIAAYPLGLLARRALVREPLFGFVFGGPLIAFAIVAIATAMSIRTSLAPAMLVAGAWTLADAAWVEVRRGSRRTGAATHSGWPTTTPRQGRSGGAARGCPVRLLTPAPRRGR